ncbi:HD-domain/PDEase-like protein [Coprinopsis sp. MPI-PUGE-AT-0042]|nr:HD-domain/PDEase-like protein [Coprinopsis sp. MPI-PUGE-AT-0042]
MTSILPTSSSIGRAASKDGYDAERFYSPEPERHIKDIIYDLIPVAPYLTRFIDTKPFQRLRNVKQLGTTFYVWPGASHSRFEHSLGITDRDVACVEIAGLCHDLGHGPWSHVWDGIFMKNTPLSGWQHEQGSVMMFDYIIEEHKIPMSEKDVMFVKALIDGDPKKASPDEKQFLFHIVANKCNGIDVDKLDYIQRDSRMLGESISISLPRILKSARVIDNEITYNIKDADSIYNICSARFRLHKAFYNHKSGYVLSLYVPWAIEYMIVDALMSAEPYLKIAERVTNPRKFIHLSDIIMNTIEESEAPELEEARKIFTRIRHRDLYRCVDYKVVDWELRNAFEAFITPEKIVAAIRSLPPFDVQSFENMAGLTQSLEEVQPEDIVVDFSTMHYGMKAQNPLERIKFYSKTRPDVATTAGPGVYSGLLPRIHAEVMLRIFSKKPEYYGIVQAGFREVLLEMDRCVADDGSILDAKLQKMVTPPPSSKSEGGTDIDASNAFDPEPTPPTAIPATPGPAPGGTDDAAPSGGKRSFSRHTSGSFAPNPFTSVGAAFVPQSPSGRSSAPLSKRGSVGDFSFPRSTPSAHTPLAQSGVGNVPTLPGGDPLASPTGAARGSKRLRDDDAENSGVKGKRRRA